MIKIAIESRLIKLQLLNFKTKISPYQKIVRKPKQFTDSRSIDDHGAAVHVIQQQLEGCWVLRIDCHLKIKKGNLSTLTNSYLLFRDFG